MSGAFEIRRVRPEEEDAAIALVYTPPGPEGSGLYGSEERAHALGRGMHELGLMQQAADELWVAVDESGPIGVLIGRFGAGASDGVRWANVPALLGMLLRQVPLRECPRLIYNGLLRIWVDLPVPEGSYRVAEVHVAPAHRGRGIGAALLGAAEAQARSHGLEQLSLTTLTTNPARRLYARQGYAVVREANVRGYESRTGSPGRVLMTKYLAAQAPAQAGASGSTPSGNSNRCQNG